MTATECGYSGAGGHEEERRRAGVARRRRDLARRPAALVRRCLADAAGVVWRFEHVTRARSVLGYRLRKAPLDLLRLVWFVVRGHGRWISKAWTFFTYGDLRSDARAARIEGDRQARRAAQEMLRGDSRARRARAAMLAEGVAKTAVALGVAALVLWLVDSMVPRAEMWPGLATLYEILATAGSVTLTAAPILAMATVAGWLGATAYKGRDKTPGGGVPGAPGPGRRRLVGR